MPSTSTLLAFAAAAVGLSALLASSATAFAFVKYAGAAYLVYLGLRMLLGRRRLAHEPEAPPAGRNVFRQAVLVRVLKPKVAIFFLAFLPQFVDPARPAASQIVVLGRPWSRWASGGLYIALGAYAALSPAQRTR